MRIQRLLLSAPLCLFLSGCLTVPSASERLSAADHTAHEAGLRRSTIRTALLQTPVYPYPPFVITAYSRIREPGQDLHVYIEGDGYAWVTRNRVSGDPTPRRPVALELAAQDPAPNVVYLARPCQYTTAAADPACDDEGYWTDKRFSEEVVRSMDLAAGKFAKDAGSPGVHLVGYSGGGAVAVLIAARRQDVRSLRTVAGNLDPNGLNEYHEVSPLAPESLDPMEVAGKLASIPQYHFTGSEDAVVPAFIAGNFAAKLKGNACVHVEPVQGPGHAEGWTEVWPRLLKLPLDCSQ